MAYSPDVNEVTDDDVTSAGKYLVFNIFSGLGGIIILIILVGVIGVVLGAFGMTSLLKFGRK